ncbi:SET domain-containing protein [Aulographum hederae CBS 113979]|uniref:SET domain-containing protein n=1 Tax=Aulographum hederae CBS 113979 TaxID=1176131 RepID=A0A6G1GLH3_9PEZI|nr:SET domain-containing protein [Aulographum hederae CBS 113979]
MAASTTQDGSDSVDYTLFSIRPAKGKGLGAFALKSLEPGTRILIERPLMVIPDPNYLQANVDAAFDPLPQASKDKIWALSSAHGQDPAMWPAAVHESVNPTEKQRINEQHFARINKDKTLMSIIQTNAVGITVGPRKEDAAAILEVTSRFNHSCLPNAHFAWNSSLGSGEGRVTIQIVKNVKEGEEITICYTSPFLLPQARRWELKHYGFECNCPACGPTLNPKSFASKSYERRAKLMALEETSGLGEVTYEEGQRVDGANGADNANEIKRLLEMIGLCLEEGLASPIVAEICIRIADICEQAGDLVHGHQAARKGYEMNLLCLGADHETTQQITAVLNAIEIALAKKLKK